MFLSQRTGVLWLNELDKIYICTWERKFIIISHWIGLVQLITFCTIQRRWLSLLMEAIIQEWRQKKTRSSKHLPLTGKKTDELIFLILKMGHCILGSNLRILMTVEPRECWPEEQSSGMKTINFGSSDDIITTFSRCEIILDLARIESPGIAFSWLPTSSSLKLLTGRSENSNGLRSQWPRLGSHLCFIPLCLNLHLLSIN